MPLNDPNNQVPEPCLPEDGSTHPAAPAAPAGSSVEPTAPVEPETAEAPTETPAEPAAPEKQTSLPADQAQPAPVTNALAGVVVEARPRPAASPQNTVWERPGWWALAIAVILAVILSSALSLGVLASANHGLLYASPSDVLALQAKLDALQSRLDTQEQDLNGLRARLEAVEKLAGRTTTLEQAAQNLRSELEKRGADLDSLRGVVSEAQKQIEQVITQSSAFETFVSGMRSLLDKLPLPGTVKP